MELFFKPLKSLVFDEQELNKYLCVKSELFFMKHFIIVIYFQGSTNVTRSITFTQIVRYVNYIKYTKDFCSIMDVCSYTSVQSRINYLFIWLINCVRLECAPVQTSIPLMSFSSNFGLEKYVSSLWSGNATGRFGTVPYLLSKHENCSYGPTMDDLPNYSRSLSTKRRVRSKLKWAVRNCQIVLSYILCCIPDRNSFCR